jgi:hypothetical protein
MPVADGPGHGLQVAGILRLVPGPGAVGVHRGVHIWAVGPGPAAELERDMTNGSPA